MNVKPFKLTAPKPFIPLEYGEQQVVFSYLSWCKLPGADLVYATLNGVRLPIGLARKMSRAGLKAGPLDINIDVARGSFHGCRIELKRKKGGVVTEVQKAWIERLRAEGYMAEVAHGAQQAITLIEQYLKMPPTIVVPFLTHLPEESK